MWFSVSKSPRSLRIIGQAAHDHAMACGARLLKEAEDRDAVEGYQVYADPAGHVFCLCWDPSKSHDPAL
jgi:glyoxalase superfamily protein